MKWRFSAIALLLLVSMTGCIYDYSPEGISTKVADNTVVVIDGDIAVGSITTIRVNITEPLLGEEKPLPLGASVWVEEEGGALYHGQEKSDETNAFEINTTSLSLQGRYRLGVSIPNRGEYLSEFKSVLITPAIDSVTCSIVPDRLSAYIEVTTHKEKAVASDTSRLYCKWNFQEHWESPSVYIPSLEYDRRYGRVVDIPLQKQVEMSKCFSEAVSSEVCINNTEKVQEDIIYKHIVNKISCTDTRAKALYSINVRQQALDKEGYNYWEIVRKNTNEIGGLFSVQPTEVRGNIKNTSKADELVIGYINVATVQNQRIYVDWKKKDFYRTTCSLMMVEDKLLVEGYISSGYIPVYENHEGILYMSLTNCADCRTYSNSAKPQWWPNKDYGEL